MKRYRPIPEFYDAECEAQESLRHDVPFFLDNAGTRKSILEFAAGTGRAAIQLAMAGHRVVGVDNDRRMLALARRKVAEAGIAARQLRLVHGDIRTLDLRERFDWVCLFYNTFLAFTAEREQDRVIQCAHRHLKPRGRFWLDIANAAPLLMIRPVMRGIEPMFFHIPTLDRSVYKTTDIRRHRTRPTQRITYHYRWFDPAGGSHERISEFDLAYHFPQELAVRMERNGFKVERTYGDHQGGDYGVSLPAIIMQCRKR